MADRQRPAGRAGPVAKADTSQPHDQKAATRTCMPLARRTARSMRKHCRRGACWKRLSAEKTKQKLKKAAHASLLRVENNQGSTSKKVIEVEDKCVKVRITVDSGVAGHVMTPVGRDKGRAKES